MEATIQLVKQVWTKPAEQWENLVKVGIQCSLYKGKEDRASPRQLPRRSTPTNVIKDCG